MLDYEFQHPISTAFLNARLPITTPCYTARRVFWCSSEPEFLLYEDGYYIGYWNTYHDGPLPDYFIRIRS